MATMDRSLRAYGWIARKCAIIAGWALMAISVATCIEIIGRKYFGFSFRGIDEIGGYMLAGISAFGFAYALANRSHMRVTLLFPYIPRRLQAALNVLALATLAVIAVFCAWRGGFEVMDGLISGKRSNTPLAVPTWIPLAIWFSGMVLFAAGTVLMTVHSLRLLFTDTAKLNVLYGPQSLDEEIVAEVSHAEAREGLKKAAAPP